MKCGDENRDVRESEFYAWVSFETSSDPKCVEGPCDLPQLKSPTGLARRGDGKESRWMQDRNFCWRMDGSVKNRGALQLKRLFSFQYRATRTNGSVWIERSSAEEQD